MGDSTGALTELNIITRSTLFASTALTAAIVGGIVAFLILPVWKPQPHEHHDDTQSACIIREGRRNVPFVAIHEPNWNEIHHAMEKYQEEVTAILNGLSGALEVAQASEWEMFGDVYPDYLLSKQLQRRIDELASLLDHNTKLFQQHLFTQFPLTMTLPVVASPSRPQEDPWSKTTTASQPKPSSYPPRRATKVTEESSSYDSISQVMAHITRDWTVLGQSVRQRTYDWCRQELAERVSPGASLLIPGAGLGRLAYEFACDGFSVEANDSSLLMASAAHALLQKGLHGTIYPFVMDFFTNEVDSEYRYEAVHFPDRSIQHEMRGSLSYTVGDFVGAYSSPHAEGRYGAIVTCFFLDTATNIYEYLIIIRNVLSKGGVWINVGPLQWHRNALLFPSADELKGLIEFMGFRIQYWSIDLEAIDYRCEDNFIRSTKDEAFRPLRIVAVRGDTQASFKYDWLFQRRHSPKKGPDTSSQSSQPTVVIEEL